MVGRYKHGDDATTPCDEMSLHDLCMFAAETRGFMCGLIGRDECQYDRDRMTLWRQAWLKGYDDGRQMAEMGTPDTRLLVRDTKKALAHVSNQIGLWDAYPPYWPTHPRGSWHKPDGKPWEWVEPRLN